MNIKKLIATSYIKILKVFGYDLIHFIHIGKTAGTAIKNSFAEKPTFIKSISKSNKKLFLMGAGHTFTFKDIPDDEFCFFVVRDPISKFVSGFYSRLRMGETSTNPYREGELESFDLFKTVNQLGEALSSNDLELKKAAEKSLQTIGHVKQSYWDWFISPDYLNKNKTKIAAILTQENLSDDFQKFIIKQNLDISLPKDKIKSHKMPDNFDKNLSDLALLNLKKWYQKDYEFLNILYNENLISKKYE